MKSKDENVVLQDLTPIPRFKKSWWKNPWFKMYWVLTLVFLVLFDFKVWEWREYEYKFLTTIRMHALDIQTNNTSQLLDFDPDKCSIKRTYWHFEKLKLIEVTCKEKNFKEQSVEYKHKFSVISRHFDKYYERFANRGNKLVTLSDN